MEPSTPSTKKIGKYKILRTLGYGGTCKVKLGIDSETGAKVAIKLLKDGLNLDIVKTEVESMKNLDHPNILKLLEYGEGYYEKEGKAPK